MSSSQPTTGLKRICELNAHGLVALARGQVDRSSIMALKSAMQAMDQLCTVAPNDMQSPAQPSLAFRAVPVAGLSDSNFYIFNQAFLVNPNSCNDSDMLTTTNMALMCATLTFNMALTYHLLGSRSGDSRKLRTASLLYGNSVEMASSVEGLPQPVVGDSLYVLHMVAMNNAAQIQYSLANFAESDELLSHVRQMMGELLDSGSPCPVGETDLLCLIPSESVDEISLNAAVCTHPTTAPTA